MKLHTDILLSTGTATSSARPAGTLHNNNTLPAGLLMDKLPEPDKPHFQLLEQEYIASFHNQLDVPDSSRVL